MTVLSVVNARDNGTLIAEAAKLWIRDDDTILDATYGRGNFWTKYPSPDTPFDGDAFDKGMWRFWTNDLDENTDADYNHDFTRLPSFWRDFFDVAVYDPAYLPQGGRETSTLRTTQTVGMLERYGLVDVPKTVDGMNAKNAAGLLECARVLRPGGRLLVKTMDYISSGKYHSGQGATLAAAAAAGLTQVDLFIHHSGTGPQPKTNRDGSPRRQVHSRRSHSYLVVFQKGNKWATASNGAS